MKGEIFWLARLADDTQLVRDLRRRFIPRNTFPLSFPAFTDALQRIQQALGVVLMVQSCVATCAQATAAVGVVRVAFNFDDAVVFDVTNDAANGKTLWYRM